ncbi:hypothetical protein C2845_PM17G05800 [Panicum miliaceum]|uniref:Uncharacterized protein n=1 Tax=Panicum miliaceum TaxID=4540 RepID=A0A3L6PYY1_PANMI|nr:hypothetical protein C2845_PM17G05800 [Panicum miliaceum]
MEDAKRVAMESVTHEPATYALHSRRGALCWLRLVLGGIGINPDCVKLSVSVNEWRTYLCHTTTLVVLPDPEVLGFEEEMTHNTSTLNNTVVQSAARKMMKILLTKFPMSTSYTPLRLYPHTVSPDEDPGALDQEGLTVTRATGSYLADLDHLMESRAREIEVIHDGYHASARLAEEYEKDARYWRAWAVTATRRAKNGIHTQVHTQLSEYRHQEARIKVEEELQKAEKELQILHDEKVEWEKREKGYVTTINMLTDRVMDREAECHSLQGEVDDL